MPKTSLDTAQEAGKVTSSSMVFPPDMAKIKKTTQKQGRFVMLTSIYRTADHRTIIGHFPECGHKGSSLIFTDYIIGFPFWLAPKISQP
jgi:hypothetical protein